MTSTAMNSDSGGRDSNSRPTSWSRKRLNDDVYNNTQRQTKIPFKKGVIQSQSFNVDNVKDVTRLDKSSSTDFPGFNTFSVPYDGNCLFSSIAHQLQQLGIHDVKHTAMDIRRELVNFIRCHGDIESTLEMNLRDCGTGEEDSNLSLHSYLHQMETNAQSWGDGNMISVASRMYGRPVLVYEKGVTNPMRIESPNEQCQDDAITIGFVPDIPGGKANHYISLLKITESLECGESHPIRSVTTSNDVDTTARESETCDVRTPKKKRKAGAAVCLSTFDDEWSKKWPFIVNTKSSTEFRCIPCMRAISCSHMGIADVKRHLETNAHKSIMKVFDKQPGAKAFVNTDSELYTSVIEAEVRASMFLCQHNLPLSTLDHLGPLMRSIFPDSKIAAKFRCGRTKTSAMINAIGPECLKVTVDAMKISPFSICTDGSSDNGLVKMNPMLIHVMTAEGMQSQLLDMGLTTGSTAQLLFDKMNNVMVDKNLSWQMCVAIGVDNAAVNMGGQNSIKTRALAKNPSIFMAGCNCHVAHNAARKAASVYAKETSFDVDQLCIDLFYYFDKSTKRKQELLQFSNFCDQEYRGVIKHVCTRWLSLESSVERVLQQLPSLRSYFASQSNRVPKVKCLDCILNDPRTEIHLLFMLHALQAFKDFNLLLQNQDSLIAVLGDESHKFTNKIASKFMKPQCIKDTGGADVDVDNEEHWLSDMDLIVGFTTRQKVTQLIVQGIMTDHEAKAFYRSCRSFWKTALTYSRARLPLKDDLVRSASCIHVETRLTASFSNVEYIVNRFPFLRDLQAPQEADKLQEEFVEYQTYAFPSALVEEKSDVKLWLHLAHLKTTSGLMRFGRLYRVAQAILVIPHSNAQEEGLFSMIRKNLTDTRKSLDINSTLGNMLKVKLAQPDSEHPCYTQKPTTNMLAMAKKATKKYNDEHSK